MGPEPRWRSEPPFEAPVTALLLPGLRTPTKKLQLANCNSRFALFSLSLLLLLFFKNSLSRLNFKALDFLGKTRLEETSHHSIFCPENEKNVNFPIITTIILDVSNENQKNNIEETSSS